MFARCSFGFATPYRCSCSWCASRLPPENSLTLSIDSEIRVLSKLQLSCFNLFSSTSPCVPATSLEISPVVLVCCKVASFSAHARSSVSCAPVACCHLFLVCQFCIRRDMCTHHAAYRNLHNPSPPTNLLGPSSKDLTMFDYTSVICKRITTAPADLQRPSHPQRTRSCFRILHHRTPLPLGFFFTISFPTPTILPPPPLLFAYDCLTPPKFSSHFTDNTLVSLFFAFLELSREGPLL